MKSESFDLHKSRVPPTLPSPVLCLITDRKRFPRGLEETVDLAIRGGVNMVQLREKDLSPEALLPLARALREVTRNRALLILNGSLEVAKSADADGVHWPEASSTPQSESPSALLTGRSTHTIEDAALFAPCSSYLQAGHVFETASHPGQPPRGTEWLRLLTASVNLPVIAVGGISAVNAGECVQAGAAGVAVISAIGAVPDARLAARNLWNSLLSAENPS